MLQREKVNVVVDDRTIAAGDLSAILDPIWWSGAIYQGPVVYEQRLRAFSQSLRYVYAVQWYLSEVCNGGHRQFYSNPTGVVWRDALAGLEALGIPEAANILRLSADRMGGSPSLDRAERHDQLKERQTSFEDCDEALYGLKKRIDFGQKMIDFIRQHPSDFYFSGTIERPVLPNLRSK
jgi:hypothetical protein